MPNRFWRLYKLKLVSNNEKRATLRQLFRFACAPRGRNRKRLEWDLLGRGSLKTQINPQISKSQKKAFWKGALVDGGWADYEKSKSDIRKIYFITSIRKKRKLKLLIVDEAHKLESKQNQSFFDHVFRNKIEKIIFVTATPFSMRISQFKARLQDLFELTGHNASSLKDNGRLWILLKRYRDIVAKSDIRKMSAKYRRDMEKELGKYFIRSVDKQRDRKPQIITSFVKNAMF